jgi:ribonuclease HI
MPESVSHLIAHIDGGARGNPGPAAYAVVIETADGRPLESLTGLLGHATNNVAEYRALLAALDYARRHGARRLTVLSDSELLVRQIRGTYKVKSEDLKPLHTSARGRIQEFDSFTIKHIPRAENQVADRLVNQALDAAVRGGSFEPGRIARPIRTRAVYQDGVLKPSGRLDIKDGEEVEVEIRRRG